MHDSLSAAFLDSMWLVGKSIWPFALLLVALRIVKGFIIRKNKLK